jgi:hypothetical protein
MMFLISGGKSVNFAIVIMMVGWLISLSACGFAADGLENEEEGDNVTAGGRVAPKLAIPEGDE